MKVVITTVLALGLGFSAVTAQAAAAPPSGLQPALAAQDGLQLAQVNPPARPVARGPAVRGPVVRGPAVRGPVYRGAVVGPRYGVVGRPGVVYRGAYVRGYRPWYRRPYFGTVVGGIALGTVLTAAAIGVAPAAPAPGLCWYWADPSQTTGYWDYC